MENEIKIEYLPQSNSEFSWNGFKRRKIDMRIVLNNARRILEFDMATNRQHRAAHAFINRFNKKIFDREMLNLAYMIQGITKTLSLKYQDF